MDDILLTAAELSEMDVDISSVNICSQLRKCALSEWPIKIERSGLYDGGRSQCLIDSMEWDLSEYNRTHESSLSPEGSFRNYIQKLQPYNVRENRTVKGNERKEAEIGYLQGIPFYVTMIGNTEHRMIVSFREEQKEVDVPGGGKRKPFAGHEFLPVITGDYMRDWPDRNSYLIRFPYYFGMRSFDMELHNARMTDQGYFVVRSSSLYTEIISLCNDLFRELMDVEYEQGNHASQLVLDDIQNMLKNPFLNGIGFHFSTTGTTIQSVLSFLIDIKVACQMKRYGMISDRKTLMDYEEKVNLLIILYLSQCGPVTDVRLSEVVDFLDGRYSSCQNNGILSGTVNDIISLLSLFAGLGDASCRVIDDKKDWDRFVEMNIIPEDPSFPNDHNDHNSIDRRES